ncbi:RNase A-like domain-containing protein, partial [Chimaeribacter californicus]|uniref:RNase A-like domain-containing protein n=1 Tax=Chimaeribacter californicus TaxID=2060067 RepID=UPI0030C6AB89
HEQTATTGTIGGHTLSRHVGKSEDDLIALLAAEPDGKMISSFYHDQNFAETVIAKAILDNLHRVYNWYYRIADPAGVPQGTGGGNKRSLFFTSECTFPVGFGYRKVKNLADDTYIYERLISSHVFVKLTRGDINGRNKFIVTAFPSQLVPEAL